MEKNAQYYLQRVEQERAAAANAKHPLVRERHEQMAAAYELRLRAIAAEEARMSFRLVTAA